MQAVDTAFAGGLFAPEKVVTYSTVLTPPNGVPVPGDTDGDGIVSQSELASVLAKLNGDGIVSQSELDAVLANYWPYSPWLYMTNVAGLGGTNVTFALSNSARDLGTAIFTQSQPLVGIHRPIASTCEIHAIEVPPIGA